MSRIPRRTVLGFGLGLAASRALAQGGKAAAMFKPESGASLRLLRWSGFVKSDEELWNANTKRFTEATGVPVSVEYITWEDVRPKAALAANLGTGPDLIMGWYDDPHIYPQKLVDVTDVAESLGKQFGGWYDVARTYGYSNRMKHWIAVPVGGTVECLTYRKSWVKEAGFEEFPRTPANSSSSPRRSRRRDIRWASRSGMPWATGTTGPIGSSGPSGARRWRRTTRPSPSPRSPASMPWNMPRSCSRTWCREWPPGSIPTTTAPSLRARSRHQQRNQHLLRGEEGFPQIAEDIHHAEFPIGPAGRPTELAKT